MRNYIFIGFVACCGIFSTAQMASACALTFTLTEVNDTTLNWSWNNGPSGTLTASSADNWSTGNSGISGTQLGFSDSLSNATWTEPDNAAAHNLVNMSTDGSGTYDFSVVSDLSGAGSNADGTRVSSLQSTFAVIFVDQGDGAVPDSGSTFLLLMLGLVGLGLFQRRVLTRQCV